MNRLLLLSAALFAAVPAAAQDQPQPAPAATEVPKDFDLAKEKVLECAGQKFVFAWGAGAHPTKVTLCSDKGASTDEVIKMLGDAATKIEATSTIPEDRRTALAQQMRAKVTELKMLEEARKPAASLVAQAPQPPVSTPAPAVNDTAAAVAAVSDSPPPAPAASAPARVLPPPPAKPRLTFSCIDPQFPGGADCVSLSRDTILNVRAGEALPAGVSLRFLRNGQARGEIALGAMRSGRSVNFSLPRELCSGVVSSEVQMVVVRSGQSVERRGPFLLRC
jgi:hypothetical protein